MKWTAEKNIVYYCIYEAPYRMKWVGYACMYTKVLYFVHWKPHSAPDQIVNVVCECFRCECKREKDKNTQYTSSIGSQHLIRSEFLHTNIYYELEVIERLLSLFIDLLASIDTWAATQCPFFSFALPLSFSTVRKNASIYEISRSSFLWLELTRFIHRLFFTHCWVMMSKSEVKFRMNFTRTNTRWPNISHQIFANPVLDANNPKRQWGKYDCFANSWLIWKTISLEWIFRFRVVCKLFLRCVCRLNLSHLVHNLWTAPHHKYTDTEFFCCTVFRVSVFFRILTDFRF